VVQGFPPYFGFPPSRAREQAPGIEYLEAYLEENAMRWNRLMIAAVAGMTASVGFAACGSGSGLGSLGLVSKAYADTIGTNSAQVAMNVDISANGHPQQASSTGAVNWTTKEAQFTITATGAAAPIQERLVNNMVYVQVPPADQAKTEGKSWVEATTGAASDQSQGLNKLIQPDDPQGALQVLQSQSSQVTRVGKDTINGTSTTHYRAVYDVTKANSGASPTQIQQFLQATGSTTIPVDIWLDAAGRVRRLVLSLSVIKLPQSATAAEQAQAQSVLPLRITVTTDLSAFGTPLTVTAPPASQVAPASALATA
jgi:hypothetical protein